MASFSYSDDEDQKRGAQQDKFGQPQAPTGPTPTFAELQRRGMPRPPPQMGAASQALYGAAGMSAPPPASPPTWKERLTGNPNNPAGPIAQPPPPMPFQGHGGVPPGYTGPNYPAAPRPTAPNRYMPTGMLDQGNLEGYLYDMLANPTATPTYKDTMRHIKSGIDTEASKRGVFYSTLPVGAYGEAGAQLAAGLQGQAYDQLRGYNRDYAELLMALLGAS